MEIDDMICASGSHCTAIFTTLLRRGECRRKKGKGKKKREGEKTGKEEGRRRGRRRMWQEKRRRRLGPSGGDLMVMVVMDGDVVGGVSGDAYHGGIAWQFHPRMVVVSISYAWIFIDS